MDNATKDELRVLVLRLASKATQSTALNASALQLYADGETDKAQQTAKASDNAKKLAEKAHQDILRIIDEA